MKLSASISQYQFSNVEHRQQQLAKLIRWDIALYQKTMARFLTTISKCLTTVAVLLLILERFSFDAFANHEAEQFIGDQLPITYAFDVNVLSPNISKWCLS